MREQESQMSVRREYKKKKMKELSMTSLPKTTKTKTIILRCSSTLHSRPHPPLMNEIGSKNLVQKIWKPTFVQNIPYPLRIFLTMTLPLPLTEMYVCANQWLFKKKLHEPNFLSNYTYVDSIFNNTKYKICTPT